MSTDTQERDYCSICRREGEFEEAGAICFNCDKPMCDAHANNHETEGRFCDDCKAN